MLRFLRRLSLAQRVLLAIVALAAIVGGFLLYREWDARQPMDLSIPEPEVLPITPTAMEAGDEADHESSVPHTSPPATGTPTDIATETNITATPSATSPTGTSEVKPLALKADEIGRLFIGKKGISIKYGVDAETLKKHVGWMESSIEPGSVGVCVLMGHRDKELRNLKNVKIGSVLTVQTEQGCYDYTVYAMDILDKDTPAAIQATDTRELMLITCYPFYYSGCAPQQLVVRARQQ